MKLEKPLPSGTLQGGEYVAGLMNEDEERHDHKPGEQQRGGNAPEQACGCGGDWAGRPLGRKRRIQNAIPVRLRGGPPPRAEAACGSSSNSFSAKS